MVSHKTIIASAAFGATRVGAIIAIYYFVLGTAPPELRIQMIVLSIIAIKHVMQHLIAPLEKFIKKRVDKWEEQRVFKAINTKIDKNTQKLIGEWRKNEEARRTESQRKLTKRPTHHEKRNNTRLRKTRRNRQSIQGDMMKEDDKDMIYTFFAIILIITAFILTVSVLHYCQEMGVCQI